jgi:uncharacterized protein (TIGR00303 family)
MVFLSKTPAIRFERPLFAVVLGNTLLSTVPGISGAGPSPQGTLLTPVLDAELVLTGAITSRDATPNTPTGCPTPASVTRAAIALAGLVPLFVNAGLAESPTVPCLDVYGAPGRDPRYGQAVPDAERLVEAGRSVGRLLSSLSDLLVLGECVPGGTTTALCVLRALGHPARTSSSYVANPMEQKEAVARSVLARLGRLGPLSPLEVLAEAGDPMLAATTGIAEAYTGTLLLAGGTQQLAVAAVLHALGEPVPRVVTTSYVRDDTSANFAELAARVGADPLYIDPGFGELGHPGLARYCAGEVKEGTGMGGALALAALLGHSPEAIRGAVLSMAKSYS